MSIQSTRCVILENIVLPVSVVPVHTTGIKKNTNKINEQIENLNVTLEVNYKSAGDLKAKSLDGVWYYGNIYKSLCLSEPLIIQGQIENALEECIKKIEASAISQKISLLSILAKANLVNPKVILLENDERVTTQSSLQAQKYWVQPIHSNHNMQRSSHISNYPLTLNIDHTWCTGVKSVEHINPVKRVETVFLSIEVKATNSVLPPAALKGIFSYEGLASRLQKIQKMEITGHVEQVCDIISKIIAGEAHTQGLELSHTIISVQRAGYAGRTPIIRLINQY